MKTFLTLLLFSVSSLCFAQKDTIFILESELKNEPIKVAIPDSVVNPIASTEDNGFVFLYKKDKITYDGMERIFYLSRDVLSKYREILYFDKNKGKNLIKTISYDRKETLPWGPLFFMVISFYISLYLQIKTLNTLNRPKLKSRTDIAWFVALSFLFYFICFAHITFCHNLIFAFIIWLLISILLCTVWVEGARGDVTKKTFWTIIVLETIIFGALVIFSETFRTIGVSILIGLYSGIVLFYLWFLWKNWKLIFHKKPKNRRLLLDKVDISLSED